MLITDRDPILAAKAIPLELIENISQNIQKGYEKAKNVGHVRACKITSLDNLVHSDLTYSKKNCEWYKAFYKELQDISKVAGIFIIPDLDIRLIDIKQSSTFMINPFNLHSPNLDEFYQDLIELHKDSYFKLTDIYSLSRMMLLDMNPHFEDFVKGIPCWLVNASNTLVQAYDLQNRRHIKIIKDGERLRYLTSIISDRWQEIENVPKEMDVIIKYLVSNRPNLAFTNQ